MANITITQELFFDMIQFVVANYDPNDDLCLRLKQGLNTKLLKMRRRELYTQYKNANDEDKYNALLNYLSTL